jgi:hypothetical protein
MKKQISPAFLAVVVVIVLAIIGGIGYKVFGPQHLPGAEDVELRKKYFPNGYPYTKDELKQPGAPAAPPAKPSP